MKTVPLTGIAKRVFDDIMALPPEAGLTYATMVVSGGLQHDLETHAEMIGHRVNQILAKRVDTLGAVLKRSAISKAQAGGEIDHLERANQALQAIAKAGNFDFLTDAERRRLVSLQDREQSGRFKAMNQRRIKYDVTAKTPLPGMYSSRVGMSEAAKTAAKTLPSRDRARYQQAYLQVKDMMRGFDDLPVGAGVVALTYRKGDGRIERIMHDISDDVSLTAANFLGGGRLVDAQVIVDSQSGPEATGFNLVGALGSPVLAGRYAASMKPGRTESGDIIPGSYEGAQNLGSFADDWEAASTRNDPGGAVFGRLGSGSKLLSDLLGPHAPMKLQLALKTADQVSMYGPEAAKVIGPHADRAAYRYRGVEKTPDPDISQAIAQTKKKAEQEGKTAKASRDMLIYGWSNTLGRKSGQPVKTEFIESPLVDYFANRLPAPELTHLQRKSGVIPPSEGIILDRTGKVVTQAVGYGDDWYLPFNLKTLSKLKGGDYIRTRAWGGPSTEDIYAGLVSGARSVTVVSHNGVYNIEFDPSFQGTRRYNDKAARMVKRYGHLLDAAKSEQVTADVPPERKRELRDEVTRETGLDPRRRDERDRWVKAYNAALADEEAHPTMGPAARRAFAEEFASRKAGHLKTTEGYGTDWTALAASHVQAAEREARALHGTFYRGLGEDNGLVAPIFDASRDRTVQEAMAQVASPEALIRTKGWQDEFEAELEKEEARYAAQHSPLRLDGEGYHQSLRALQEQFPYYIARVDYRPHDSGPDYGYVKPRFNRPEQALAGYFDATITGKGKVGADEIRHQNRGVKVAEIKGARTQRTESTTERVGASTPAPAQSEENARIAALKALHASIAETSTFSEQGAGQGKPITPAVLAAAASSEMADLKLFKQKPWRDWFEEIMANPSAGNSMVEAARRLDASHTVDVKHNLIEAAEDPVKAAKGHKYSTELAIESPDLDFDLPDLGPNGTVAHYQRMLEINRQRLNVDETADLDDLIKRDGELYQAALNSEGSLRPHHADKFATRIKLAVQVKQAVRRLVEAEEKAARIEALEQQRTREQLEKPIVVDVRGSEANDKVTRALNLGDNGKTVQHED